MVDTDPESEDAWTDLLSPKSIFNAIIGSAIFYVFIWHVPEWFFTFTDFTADLYAQAVTIGFYSNGNEQLTFYALAILCAIINLRERTLLTTVFGIGALLIGLSLGFANDVSRSLQRELTEVRPALEDSTYWTLRANISEIATYEDLQDVRTRIDSLDQN